MRTTILILFCVLSINVSTQTVITGTVTDKQQNGVSQVSITLLSLNDSSIVSYTLSKEKGFYKLTYTGKELELLISAYSFGIKKQSKKITNKTQSANFIVEEGGVELKEVIVKSKKIYGAKDTINYSVSTFKDTKDVVIGDVLKKMPGIQVSEDGQISYQGKPINKFYIEGMDLLGGRYGIATKNVSAEDVATVQVLENHQPIKALETTTISTDAAINLKIKEDKKGIFTSRATTGLGSGDKLLWQGELNGMYFGRVYQNISIYKADNFGKNIVRELYLGGELRGLELTNLAEPSTPPLRQDRYLFNNDHVLTLNNLNRFKNGANLNYNFTFSSALNQQHGYSNSQYYLSEDSSVSIVKDISNQKRTTKLEGELRYQLNKTDQYLSNRFNIKSEWTNGTGKISTSTATPMNQKFKSTYFTASNSTQLIKKQDEEHGFIFSSVNAILMQPHSLNIDSGLYPEVLNDSLPYQSLKQKINAYGISSNNDFSFLTALSLGNIRISPSAGIYFQHTGLKSDLNLTQTNGNVILLNDTLMQNELTNTKIAAALGLNIEYRYNNLEISAGVPISFRHTIITDALREKSTYLQDRFYLKPSLTVKYSLSAYWEMNANYKYDISTPGLSKLYSGYILSSYNNINRYETQLYNDYNHNGTFNILYKNLLSMIFMNISTDFKYNKSDFIYSSAIIGSLFINQLKKAPNENSFYSIKGNISKGFNWKSLNLSLGGEWSTYKGSFFRQNQLMNFKNQSVILENTIYLKVFKWFITNYNGNWRRNESTLINTKSTTSITQTITNKIETSFFLPYNIGINCSYENYYNNRLRINKKLTCADIGLTYMKKGVRYSLDWTNIFNNSKYVSAYSGIDTYYAEYYIRPSALMLRIQFRLK